MSIPGAANPLLLATAAAGGYNVERSLRFNSSDSAYLSRTPASAGNRKTWTYSTWVKRSDLGTFQRIISNGDSGLTSGFFFQFNDTNTITLFDYTSSSVVWTITTSQVFRDVSSWYHIALAYDTTQATASDRIKLYVNGERVTAFSSASYPSQNYDGYWNGLVSGNTLHTIGRTGSSASSYFSGYFADIHFIDGQALTPSSFTEVSATTGQLIPKAYTGSFGTNGFWLKFSDNSNNTATTLGKDYSGNNNNWTPNNFSVTSGAGNDSLVDTPTSYGTDTGAGGEVRGNYATLNPLSAGAGATLSNGNLDLATDNANVGQARSTIGVSSGKWYFEVVKTGGSANPMIGIVDAATPGSNYPGQSSGSYGYYGFDGKKYNNNSPASYGASYGTNDVIGVALDLDAGTLVFYKNGVSQGTAYSSLTGTFFPAVADDSGSTSLTATVNFGQRPFAYTAPSGFKALVDTNIPVVIAKSSDYFQTLLYTGNGSTQTVGGLSFSPDLVWLKGRSVGYSHQLYDQIRGAGKLLNSNTTNAEATVTDNLTAFTSNGFTLGNDAGTNQSSASYVAWAFDAGSNTVSNTQGSITSQVRANASAGFSVVTYTGNGTNPSTVGHGLGVAPSFIIHKCRSDATNWFVYHRSAGNGAFEGLNTTAAYNAGSGAFGSTAPTSTVLTTGGDTNTNGRTYVDYCFAPVAGYSSMGAFSTATASTDGVFVYTNHRPRWVLIKKTSATGPWIIYDAVRNTYNAANNELRPNTSEAENGGLYLGQIDILSNGFKVRSNSSAYVGEVGDFVYCSFAESPFQYARAR